jgi:uncharacterized damage-inducible protein DinB
MADETPERWTAATERPDIWLDPSADPRYAGEIEITDERTNLLEYLRVYRLTMEEKCSGLTAEQLARRSVPPSTMSLLGLIRHMADVERNWFRRVMAGETLDDHFATAEDRDNDWHGARADQAQVDEAWAAWRAEVAQAEEITAGIDDLGQQGRIRQGTIALREVLLHMVEEYARHCGHADLLRECIDGRVGQ